jgi:hypothetical protein
MHSLCRLPLATKQSHACENGLQDVRNRSHHNTLRSSKPLSLPLCCACACIHSSSQLSLLKMQWLQLASRPSSLVASQGWAAAACSSSLSGTLRLVSSSTVACKEGALPNSCECFCAELSGYSQLQQGPTGHGGLNFSSCVPSALLALHGMHRHPDRSVARKQHASDLVVDLFGS